MKTIMNHQDQDYVDAQANTPETNIYNEPILSSSTISEINKHFFEKHRNSYNAWMPKLRNDS